MFDLPVLVELLGYLNDKDTFVLALTNRQLKEDIMYFRERCNYCADKGAYCIKRKCHQCSGDTCRSKALTYTECISSGDESRIEKKIVVCDDCGVLSYELKRCPFTCQICRKIGFLRSYDSGFCCDTCKKRLCVKCLAFKSVPNIKMIPNDNFLGYGRFTYLHYETIEKPFCTDCL